MYPSGHLLTRSPSDPCRYEFPPKTAEAEAMSITKARQPCKEVRRLDDSACSIPAITAQPGGLEQAGVLVETPPDSQVLSVNGDGSSSVLGQGSRADEDARHFVELCVGVLGVATQYLERALVIKRKPFHKDALGPSYKRAGVDGLPQ